MPTIITRQLRPDLDSGTADGTSANKLIDSTQDFTTSLAGVTLPCVLRNTTDTTRALVTAVDSDTQLSLDTDIIISGESYVIGGDYTSINTWYSNNGDATSTDLVANDEAVVLECYKGNYTSHGGGIDYIIENVVLNATWTTDATRNITIRCPSTEKHNGIPQSGFQVRNNGDANTITVTSVDFIFIENLEIILTQNVNYRSAVVINNVIANILFSKCICSYTGTSTPSIFVTNLRNKRALESSIIIATGAGTPSAGVTFSNFSDSMVENITVVNCTTGFSNPNTATYDPKIRNCVTFNCTNFHTDAGSGYHVDTGYNASSTYSTVAAPDNVGSSNYTSDVVSGDFVNTGGNDFHLSSGSALRDKGINLTSLFTEDIDGDVWPAAGAWDIGADYFVSNIPTLSAATAAPLSDNQADGTVITDIATGDLYWIISTSATQPSVVQIQAGQDHTGSLAADSGNQTVSASGVLNITGNSVLSPNTSYYIHYQHKNGVDDSTITTSNLFETAPSGFLYVISDGTTPITSIFYIVDGTHNGSDNDTVLTDTTASFPAPDGYVDLQINNDTDISFGDITANTATTITGTLSGGTDNDWDIGDSYSVNIKINNLDRIFYEPTTDVLSEQYQFDYKVFDMNLNTMGTLTTATVLVPGSSNGHGAVSLDTSGTPTVNLVSKFILLSKMNSLFFNK